MLTPNPKDRNLNMNEKQPTKTDVMGMASACHDVATKQDKIITRMKKRIMTVTPVAKGQVMDKPTAEELEELQQFFSDLVSSVDSAQDYSERMVMMTRELQFAATEEGRAMRDYIASQLSGDDAPDKGRSEN